MQHDFASVYAQMQHDFASVYAHMSLHLLVFTPHTYLVFTPHTYLVFTPHTYLVFTPHTYTLLLPLSVDILQHTATHCNTLRRLLVFTSHTHTTHILTPCIYTLSWNIDVNRQRQGRKRVFS